MHISLESLQVFDNLLNIDDASKLSFPLRILKSLIIIDNIKDVKVKDSIATCKKCGDPMAISEDPEN
jgi:hypothetical protein|tara:strand:+ start:906 stop:1106 length:201 start_codon:yes stop_codon:yes gene_type:complete